MAAQRKKLPKKWLDEIAPTERVTRAARTILDARSATVLSSPLAGEARAANITNVSGDHVVARIDDDFCG